MVYYRQPDRDWELIDFQLLEAYQILQSEICPQCQNPVWLCRSSSHDVGWSVRTEVCQATKEREERDWRRENKGNPKREERAKWGRFSYVVPIVPGHRPEGTELPTRKQFYEEQAKLDEQRRKV